MKKKMLFGLTLLPCILYGQIFVDGKSLNEISNLEYIQVSYGLFGAQVTYAVGRSASTARAKNEKGENVSLSSSVVLLNYFYQNGWELLCKEDTFEYIFKKRKP